MRKTKKFQVDMKNDRPDLIATDTEGLQQILGCGRQTAIQIGRAADARIKVGKRVLWNLPRLRRYFEEL